VRRRRPVLLLSALLLLAGCPVIDDDDSAVIDDDDGTEADDDDSATVDDDDSGPDDDDDGTDDDDVAPDDDDASDPCSAVDISATVDAGTVLGSTTHAADDFKGSCQFNDAPDALYSFVAPATNGYIVSTIHPGTLYDTLIYAFADCDDPAGSELACNDDTNGLSSQIVLDLEEGELVYVVVDGYSSSGDYELSVTSVECGNGSVEGSEDCDDGNTDDGDGCSATCTWECADDALEDDDTGADATDLDALGLPVSLPDQVLCPYDNSPLEPGLAMDIYAIELEQDEYVEVEVGPGATLTPTCASQRLQVGIGASPLALGTSDDTLDGQCATLVDAPGPGTWYVSVLWTAGAWPPQDYALTVSTTMTECGNGIEEALEECDDGNTVSGDGCSSECALEDVACPVTADITGALIGGTPVFGSTALAPDDHAPTCAVGGSPELTFELTPPSDGTITASTGNPGTTFNTALYVRTECLDSGSELACGDWWGGETISWGATAGTTYFLVVDGSNGESGAFELTVTQ